MTITDDPDVVTGLRQLRHDLLNPINVLVGATAALRQTDLDDDQQAWVRMLESTTRQLRDIIERIDAYQGQNVIEGRERLLDLCSIAAARLAKPFDRARLVDTIHDVVGDTGARILLVDDSDELALLVRTYLAGTPWTLDVVDNGERAVARATTEHYDVVLMDIGLPGLDGATAAHAIRAADLARGTSPTPVIAMTAFDPGPSLRVSAADAGDAFEPIGVEDPEIAPLVPAFLANRRAEMAIFRQLLDTNEFGRIQSLAHKLKGNGRAYGFAALSHFGHEMEMAAHHQDASALRRLVDELDAYLQKVRIDEDRHAD